jgi:hypothetical protein
MHIKLLLYLLILVWIMTYAPKGRSDIISKIYAKIPVIYDLPPLIISFLRFHLFHKKCRRNSVNKFSKINLLLFITLATILCSGAERAAICTKDDTDHFCEFHWNLTSSLTCESWTIFSFSSSGDHFVQQSGTCWRYSQQGMLLIASVKFHWNPISSLTPESWARFFYL